MNLPLRGHGRSVRAPWRSLPRVSDVYGTARGLRARLASGPAGRARLRRHREFFALTGAGRARGSSTSGADRWDCARSSPTWTSPASTWRRGPEYPGPFVQADATDRLPFDDGAFDLAYCNSVIEHVAPGAPRRIRRGAEAGRRGWYVQTPAFSFPVEPHALLPFAHWLPVALRRPYWRLGVAGDWEDIHLLRRREMAALFGEPRAERVGPLAKSWVSVKAVPS